MAQKINPLSPSLRAKLKKIRLIAMDVDGVLTSGDIIVLKSGEEIKLWSAKDRLILSVMRDLKLPFLVAWITGRMSRTVAESAHELGVSYVRQKCHDKKKALQEILKKHRLSPSEAVFIGDDLIDLRAMKFCGVSVCPADAVRTIREAADYVSPHSGGKGVVRETIELILRTQGLWKKIERTFS